MHCDLFALMHMSTSFKYNSQECNSARNPEIVGASSNQNIIGVKKNTAANAINIATNVKCFNPFNNRINNNDKQKW